MNKIKTVICIVMLGILSSYSSNKNTSTLPNGIDEEKKVDDVTEKQDAKAQDNEVHHGMNIDEAKQLVLKDSGVDLDKVHFRTSVQYQKEGISIAKFVFEDKDSVFVYEVNLETGDIRFSKVNTKHGK